MAWTAVNPVAIGGATKKSDYDKVWDNAQYLKIASLAANFKLFGDAAGTSTDWAAGIHQAAFIRDMNGASGDVAYTGTGFKPVAIIFMAAKDSTVYASWGFAFAAVNALHYTSAGNFIGSGSYCVGLGDGSTWNQFGAIKTWDANGFTVTWALAGSPPAGNISVQYLAIR